MVSWDQSSHEAVRDFLLRNNICVYDLASGSAKSKCKFFNLTDYSSKTGAGISYATFNYPVELTLIRVTEQARHDYTPGVRSYWQQPFLKIPHSQG
jgi:hypothetical protein